MDEFPISNSDWQQIFDELCADRTADLIAEVSPKFFLHAGQPGSGKTFLNNLVKAQLNGNILECNADNFRDLHPDAETILRHRETDYPELTWPAATRWNNALRDEGISKRYHLFIETTLRNPQEAEDTFQRMKNAGYTTTLNVLAVPYLWSWLGIYRRYEVLKAHKGFARRVSEADHDNRYIQLPHSLAALENSPYIDHISIYRRTQMISPSSPISVELVPSDRESITASYQNIVSQKMTEAERQLFKIDCSSVIMRMQYRGASNEEIGDFKAKADRLAQM